MTSHEEIHAGKAPSTSTGRDGAEAPHKLPMRTLIAASVGNAVEWYDWTVYATFSIYFATQIFPAENESRSRPAAAEPRTNLPFVSAVQR